MTLNHPISARWPARHPDRLQLFSLPRPNGVKVGIMLEETGPAYQPHRIDIVAHENHDPTFSLLGWVRNLIGFYEARELVGFDRFLHVAGVARARPRASGGAARAASDGGLAEARSLPFFISGAPYAISRDQSHW